MVLKYSKCVRFADEAVDINDKRRLKHEVVHRLWYSGDEIKVFKAESLIWLKRGKKAKHWQDSEMTTARGYEYVYQGYSRDETRRQHSQKVVAYFRSNGHGLAKYARLDSAPTLQRARDLGWSDATEARKIHGQLPSLDYPGKKKGMSDKKKKSTLPPLLLSPSASLNLSELYPVKPSKSTSPRSFFRLNSTGH